MASKQETLPTVSKEAVARAVEDLSFLSPIEDIIDDARNGRMFILVDDEERENEGDLVIPAQMATPDSINFMATHGRGLICLALTTKRCDEPWPETNGAAQSEPASNRLHHIDRGERGRHHRDFGAGPGAHRGGGDRSGARRRGYRHARAYLPVDGTGRRRTCPGQGIPRLRSIFPGLPG